MKIKALVLSVLAISLVACNAAPESTTTSPTPTTGAMMDNSDSMDSSDSMNSDGVMVGGAMMVPSKDIVDNAVSSSDHTTLVAAVQAADLVETLKGDGPFTVFAPTNAAFDELPAGTVDGLLEEESKDDLTAILTYHVVPGRYTSADIIDGMTLETVNGESLTFTVEDGKVWVNDGAMVAIPDVISSNGVTHVIDTVLMP